MAWTWMLGVVEPLNDHFTTGASSATRTNINEYEGKAVRRIWKVTDAPYTNAANHAAMLVNNGKFVIPTIFDGAGGNEFHAQPMSTLLNRCQTFAAAMEGICTVVELVNEVDPGDHGAGGKYWDFVRQASPIFQNRGMLPILCGVPNRPSFLNTAEAEDIWPYVPGGTGIHAYHPNPGSNLTTAGTGLYYLKQRRDQLDGFGGLPATTQAGWIWLTEFGWVTKAPNPSGPGGNLICTESQFTTRLTQMHNGFVTHGETLKLAASCLFTWVDWALDPPPDKRDQDPFKYSGIRTNEAGRYQTSPWFYKDTSPDDQVGAEGAKAALDSFGEGTVAAGAAPEVVTGPPQSVAQTSAVLTGSVDPNAELTDWYFRYSTEPF